VLWQAYRRAAVVRQEHLARADHDADSCPCEWDEVDALQEYTQVVRGEIELPPLALNEDVTAAAIDVIQGVTDQSHEYAELILDAVAPTLLAAALASAAEIAASVNLDDCDSPSDAALAITAALYSAASERIRYS